MLFILPAFTTTSGYELPNDRETLYLQKVAPSSLISAVEASQSDVEPVWDLSRAVVEDDCRQRWRNFGDSVLVRIENGTQIFFEVKSDSLFLSCIENPLYKLQDSIATYIAHLPLSFCGNVASKYSLKGVYCGSNALAVAGDYNRLSTMTGTLLLPNDTISNVLLSSENIEGRISVSKDLQYASTNVTCDSVLIFTRIAYKWWHNDFCHPLARLEITKYLAQGKLISESSVAYICPPAVQEYAHISLSSLPSEHPKYYKGKKTSNRVENDTNVKDATPSNLEYDFNEETIIIKHQDFNPLSGNNDFELIVADIQGRTYACGLNRFNNAVQINTSALPSGDYLLYVKQGDFQETKRFHIK